MNRKLKDFTTYTASRLLLVLTLCIGLFAAAPASAEAEVSAPDKATVKYEIRFMQNMIDHHQMAVMMAEQCVNNAAHDELKTLCQNVITKQTYEIQEMQSWLRNWYGINYEPQMKPGDMKMMERMSMMSGAEFEIEFMQMMIKHHLKAIKEASQCIERVYHEELRDLCENIITTQAAEIEQMRTWLCHWYGICKRR